MASPGQKQAAETPREQKQTPRSCIDSKATVLVPLDLSFLNAAELADIEDEEPRPLLAKKTQKTDDEKYVASSIKLSNNMLQDLKGFIDFLDKKVADPAALSWVDVSFNQLTCIEPTLCDLPNLQILYYHSNCLQDLKEVDKLASMPSLRKLTLHGNAIEDNKNYKCSVLSRVPRLTHLDFSAVTKSDKATASTWERSAANRKKPRRKHHDS